MVLPNELRPCTVDVPDDGFFSVALTEGATTFWLYDRGAPVANERALREALPALYCSFAPHTAPCTKLVSTARIRGT